MTLVPTAAKSSSGVASAHACRVKRASGNFAVGNNVLTAVQFTAEDYDTDTMHDNSTNNTRITIPSIVGVTTGLWHVFAGGYTDATTGRADVQIRLNGTTLILMGLFAASGSGVSGYVTAGDYVFSATDYIECLVRTSGGAGNIIFDPPSPYFGAHFVSAVS